MKVYMLTTIITVPLADQDPDWLQIRIRHFSSIRIRTHKVIESGYHSDPGQQHTFLS
jgi:hypothetical protein